MVPSDEDWTELSDFGVNMISIGEAMRRLTVGVVATGRTQVVFWDWPVVSEILMVLFWRLDWGQLLELNRHRMTRLGSEFFQATTTI